MIAADSPPPENAHGRQANTCHAGRTSAPRGFALVVTISLMVLLTVVAVGLLSLSAVALRASGQGAAQAEARANARLALLLAIGELQKAAGPDQRITAPANLRDDQAQPAFTGVWESALSTPDKLPNYGNRWLADGDASIADGEFVRWLASSAAGSDSASDPNSPPESVGGSDSALLLTADDETLELPTSPISPDRAGAFAWMVIDDGIKARVDLPTDDTSQDRLRRLASLRAPSRCGIETISPDTSSLVVDRETAGKLVTFGQTKIKGGEALGHYYHDLTTWSASLPVNVAAGGLKADLTRAFEEGSLPVELERRYVFSNEARKLIPDDPTFSDLQDYYGLYEETKGGTQPLEVSLPPRFQPSSRGKIRLLPVEGNLIAPVISRVSVVFSLISHEAHGNWINTIPNATGDPRRNNMVYLIYTPVITVHNPWSVPITFQDLKVTFRNLPISFKFFRNGVAQTNNPGLLSQFHVSSQNMTGFEDPFSSTASNQPGSASDTKITLNPGEARVFGVNWPDGTRWGNMTNYLWQNDLDKSKTLDIITGPGWDYRTGFIVDWLHPEAAVRSSDCKTGPFGVRNTDTINVECGPMVPSGANGRFSVEIEAMVNRRTTIVGAYEYIYGTEERLIEALEEGANPVIGEIKFPFRKERDWRFAELYQRDFESTPVERWDGPKQFAIFTLVDRTAKDALFATKPGIHSSFAHHVLSMDITKTHPAQVPMELSLLPIRTEGANVVGSIDADANDRAYFFGGTRALTGALNHATYQVPTSPLVNMASFTHANLAKSGYLPLVAHTVGESVAPAALPSTEVVAPGPFGYQVADRAWLANNTLWDGYYLSGIRDASDATKFFNYDPLPLNPRFTPAPVPGRSAETAKAAVLAEDGWTKLAGMQLLKGGFNVNSTSVDAWKAVLASLVNAEIPRIDPLTLAETDEPGDDAPFPRLVQPLDGSIDGHPNPDNQLRWTGFRNLDDSHLNQLAEAMVEQVRKRGPFLSMSDFVNRRPGSESDPEALAGAIETAIRESGINDIPPGPEPRILKEQEAAAFGLANPTAAAGDVEEGSTAFLSQGDVMAVIGSLVTVRSDTFTIRAHGDSRDPNGRIAARAWCEAVVQRMPSFVDPTDPPDKVQAAADRGIGTLTEVNRRFGRRFEVLSFRWLAPDEV